LWWPSPRRLAPAIPTGFRPSVITARPLGSGSAVGTGVRGADPPDS
jgi:hypothetical protein